MRTNSNAHKFYIMSAFLLMAIQCSLEPYLVFFMMDSQAFREYNPVMIFALLPFGALFSGVISGALSDKYGRILLCRISIFTSALIFLSVYFLTAYFSEHIWYPALFIALVFLMGMSFSMYWPSSQAILSDISERIERVQVFRSRYVALNLGAAAGPLVVLLLGVASREETFLFAGICYLIYGFFMITIESKFNIKSSFKIHNGSKVRSNFYAALKDRRLVLSLLGLITFLMVLSQIESNIAVIIKKLFSDDSLKLLTTLVVVNTVSIFLFQPVSSFLERRHSVQQCISFGCVLGFLAALLILLFGISHYTLILFVVLISIGEVIIIPNVTSQIDSVAPENMKGAYLGLMSFKKLGNVAGPVAGAYSIQFFGATSLFGFLLVIMALSYCLFKKVGDEV